MNKVVPSRISARPSCIIQRVMSLASPEDRMSKGDTRDKTHDPRENTIRADVREDKTLAMADLW